HLNGREVHTYINKSREYSVDVPSSTLHRSEVGNRLNLNQQSSSLAALRLQKLEVRFLTKNKEKNHFKIELPLEQETTNIQYHITNDSVKTPRLKTNFPIQEQNKSSDLDRFLQWSENYVPFLIPFLILLASFVYFLESKMAYNSFSQPSNTTKIKLIILSLFLVLFTIFCIFFSNFLQQKSPSAHKTMHPLLYGQFSPSLHHNKMTQLASEENFSHLFSPHGLEENFYIELNFDKKSIFSHPIFSATFILVSSLIFLYLLQASYFKASIFLCFAIFITTLLQNNGYLPPSTYIAFAPLFIFFYPMLKKLIRFRKVASACILLSFFSSNHYSQVIDLYKYQSKDQTLTFIKQSQYPKDVSSAIQKPSSPFYRSDLNFVLDKGSLKLKASYYLTRDSHQGESIIIPRYQAFHGHQKFVIEKVSSNYQNLSIQKIEKNQIIVVKAKNFYPIIEVDYLVSHHFPKELDFHFKSPNIAIQKFYFPKIKGYRLTSKSSVYDMSDQNSYQFHLAASNKISFHFVKQQKRKSNANEPKVTKTQ
ncbi:hypothetical protein MJH12_17045, partial [bacterium]|nr:hypothetical protein [bacterium]